MVLAYQPNAQPPTWMARVSFFVWNVTHDLPGLGDRTSSYATSGITLEITGSCKPQHHKMEPPSGGTKYTWRILHILLETMIVKYDIPIPLKKTEDCNVTIFYKFFSRIAC
jgi:hypothetical protein